MSTVWNFFKPQWRVYLAVVVSLANLAALTTVPSVTVVRGMLPELVLLVFMLATTDRRRAEYLMYSEELADDLDQIENGMSAGKHRAPSVIELSDSTLDSLGRMLDEHAARMNQESGMRSGKGTRIGRRHSDVESVPDVSASEDNE